MTENERDAGDAMAKLLMEQAELFDSRGNWSIADRFRAAIKAWEDAKNEDA